jgi:hypothetical protein
MHRAGGMTASNPRKTYFLKWLNMGLILFDIGFVSEKIQCNAGICTNNSISGSNFRIPGHKSISITQHIHTLLQNSKKEQRTHPALNCRLFHKQNCGSTRYL